MASALERAKEASGVLAAAGAVAYGCGYLVLRGRAQRMSEQI